MNAKRVKHAASAIAAGGDEVIVWTVGNGRGGIFYKCHAFGFFELECEAVEGGAEGGGEERCVYDGQCYQCGDGCWDSMHFGDKNRVKRECKLRVLWLVDCNHVRRFIVRDDALCSVARSRYTDDAFAHARINNE